MAVIQLACPHCSHAFSLENPPPPGEHVPCPACGRKMAVPTESASRPANAPAPPPAERGDAEPRMRKLSRAEKIQRRQVRNIALMIFGVIVLAIAVVVLGRL